MPPVKKAPPVAVTGVNFGDLGFYSGGFQLAPGLYAMVHEFMLHQATDKNNNPKGDARLGVMLSATPISEDGTKKGEATTQFLSMGGKAHESFMPNESGKGLDVVPGGPGFVSNKANWFYYLESMWNSGLPQGILTNDLEAIDGIWVRTDLIPEPEDRKSFGAGTAEVEQEKRGPNKMPIVTEILDGGKPWEGSGGVPEGDVAPKATAKAGPKAVVKPAAKVAPKAAAVVEETAEVDEATMNAAIAGISAVLAKGTNSKGMPKLLLSTGTFKAVNDAEGAEMANAVKAAYFDPAAESVAALTDLLTQLDFSLDGNKVIPA